MWITAALLLLAAPPARADSIATIQELIAAGRYQPALEQLGRIPESAVRHVLASKAYDGLGDAAQAVREAEAALALDPRLEAAHLQLGQIFLAHNTPLAALDIFTEALAVVPDSLLLRLGRGLALKDLTRYDEAGKDLLACLKREPSLALAFDALATVYLQTRQFSEARRLADTFRSSYPADYRGHYFAAAAREGLNEPFEVIEPLLRESIARNPNFAASHALLGKLQLYGGRAAEAVPTLERAVRLRPDYTPAILHLAQAYRDTGQAERAAAAFDRVRELKRQERESPPPMLKYHRGPK